MLANCGRGDLFLPLTRSVRSVEPIFSIDQLREHWNGVLFGADTNNYLLADGAASGYIPLDVLPPDARVPEVLFRAFDSAYSEMVRRGAARFVSWSPAYLRRLTEVILAHLDHIERTYSTPEGRWQAAQIFHSQLVKNFAENDKDDPGLQQLQIRMAQLAFRG